MFVGRVGRNARLADDLRPAPGQRAAAVEVGERDRVVGRLERGVVGVLLVGQRLVLEVGDRVRQEHGPGAGRRARRALAARHAGEHDRGGDEQHRECDTRLQRSPLRRLASGGYLGSGHARSPPLHRERGGRPAPRGRADGAADRLRARPAGARPDGVHGPAEAEAAARHARSGPHREDRSGEARGRVPGEAGDPPLPREHGSPGAGARGRGGGALRRAGGAALDRGYATPTTSARGSRSFRASAR